MGRKRSIADIDEALFAIPIIVNYSAPLKRHREIDQLEVVVFPVSLRDHSAFEGIFGSLLCIPVVDRAVKGGITVGPIRFASESWGTSGVAKRAILQRTEEEVGQ